MPPLRAMLLLLSGSITLWAAGPVDSERLWTGRNGKTFRGTYRATVADGSAVEIVDSNGKLLRIAIANLSDADRVVVGAAGKGASGSGGTGVFKPLPARDRTGIPVINQGDFGQKASDCVPSSFCNFLLWWDQEKLLPIPKRGGFEAKAEWIHSKMAKYCGTRNTAGTSALEADEGFRKYFGKELAEVATLRVHRDHDLRPENLARYTQGVDAVMLELTTLQTNGDSGGHWVALVSIEPSGKLVFNTWGARFSGTMRVLKEDKSKVSPGGREVEATTYEIEISNRSDLPDWVNSTGVRLILDPAKWDGVTVVRPYVFEPGKKAPADPFFDAAPVP